MKYETKHIKPKKSLGQNFLIDENIIKKTIEAIKLKSDDIVMEIGPGEGALTQHLINKAAMVYAIEIDSRACDVLKSKFSSYNNLVIINEDFLKIDFNKYLIDNKKNKIFGNVPYYISGRIFYNLFRNAEFFSRAIITVQKEVGQRVVAQSGNKQYGILSVLSQLAGTSNIEFDVSPNCFYPKPKVTSSVVSIDFNKISTTEEFDAIASIVKQAFNQRRKKLSNSLNEYLKLLPAGNSNFINQIKDLRAENLTTDDYIKLYQIFSKNNIGTKIIEEII